MTTPNKGGRPPAYTEDTAKAVCKRLEKGETLRSICRDKSMPARSIVNRWLESDHEGFRDLYARAKEKGFDAMAEEMLSIADDGSNDWMEKHHYAGDDTKALNGEHIQRSKLRVDARKWYLSKMAPKRYGDKLEVTGTGAAQPVLNITIAAPTGSQGPVIEGETTPPALEKDKPDSP